MAIGIPLMEVIDQILHGGKRERAMGLATDRDEIETCGLRLPLARIQGPILDAVLEEEDRGGQQRPVCGQPNRILGGPLIPRHGECK